MSIYKTRKRIKGDDGQYHIVYQETSADQVKSKDGTSAEDHFSALLVSEDGVHGMRYNPAEEALEGYNPETEQWEEITSGGGGGGTPLAAVTDITTITSSGKVYVKWTDPDDIAIGETVLSKWAGTLLVRKAGSVPSSRRDGTVVVDSKTRNAYKDQYFCDTGLSDGTNYFYKFFPYTTTKMYTDDTANEFTETPNAVPTGNVSALSVDSQLNGRISLTWTDPAATIVEDGITVSTWGSTKVVYKEGSYPTSPDDGTLVLNSTTRNAHQTTPLEVTGLTNGTTYYFMLFPISTDDAVNSNSAGQITAVPNKTVISTVPSQDGTLSYTGTEQNASWSNYDPTKLTIGGVVKATDAGTYSATFTPTEDFCWDDMSVTSKTVTWKIDKATISVPTQSGTLTYNGNELAPSWNDYDSAKMTIAGVVKGTNAGDYNAKFTPTENYKWSDGTSTEKTVNWTIQRAVIANVPSQSGSLTYSAVEQSPSWSNYDTSKMTLGGITAGTDAGSYNATFTPGENYKWSDGSTTAKTVAWTIGKAAGSLSINKTSVSLTAASPNTTITVTRTGDGAISATSSNAGVAAVSVNGNVVTVTGKGTGSATITIKVAEGTNHLAPENKTCAVTAKLTTIYGVEWDGTSTTKLTRTDAAAGFTDPVPAIGNGAGSSPFDNLMPWSGMVKETDSAAGTLVKIPKFWYKLTKSGNKLKIQISDGANDGFSVSPAHMNRGDGKGERDFVYIGRYHCASGYKSTTGVRPLANITRSAARSGIHNLGTTIWQSDFAMRFTIWLLYIVEFADWESQGKIGFGCGNNSATQNMGYTDSMTYHTGTTQGNRTTYGLGTQYRWIEGLWDNVYDWMDGCYYNSNGLNIILNPNQFSDNANGTMAGTLTGGYPSALNVVTAGGFPMFVPSASSGSDQTYIPDYWGFGASYPCLFVGGNYNQDRNRGLFCVSYNGVSYAVASIGCRLQKLP